MGKDGKTTILQYVMQKVYDHDSSFFDFLEELMPKLRAGLVFDIDGIISETSSLKDRFQEIMEELETIEGSNDKDPGFVKFFKPFYLNYVDIAIDLELKAKDLKEFFVETALMMGDKPFVLKDKETFKVFQDWVKYFDEMVKTLVLVEAYAKVNKSKGLKNLIGVLTKQGNQEESKEKMAKLSENPDMRDSRGYKGKKM